MQQCAHAIFTSPAANLAPYELNFQLLVRGACLLAGTVFLLKIFDSVVLDSAIGKYFNSGQSRYNVKLMGLQRGPEAKQSQKTQSREDRQKNLLHYCVLEKANSNYYVICMNGVMKTIICFSLFLHKLICRTGEPHSRSEGRCRPQCPKCLCYLHHLGPGASI